MGAISGGGGTSRLLVDYPKRQRNQILDYLFKPNYGASMQILKVEIGADTNTSNGAEPSHMRTPGQVDCNTGYEWQMMEQAKRRNPQIKLYGLAWGEPGWIQGGFWSNDTIKYLLAWLGCAKQHHLTINYIGGHNERGFDADWFIKFRKALDDHGYQGTKLVADDNAGFAIVDAMDQDPALKNAVNVVGIHYPCSILHCSADPAAQALGKPLFASESGWNNYLTGALRQAAEMNHEYIDSRMTAFINWPATYSWYPSIQMAGSGLLKANTPWSGAYELGPTLWTMAQTTQFARPGWQYLNSGSTDLLQGGSVVALAQPERGNTVPRHAGHSSQGRNWSTIVETTAATQSQTITLDVGQGLSQRPIQQWSTALSSTNPADWFVHSTTTLRPVGGKITISLKPGMVYTFSTLTSARKGSATSPVDRPLPFFSQGFDHTRIGTSPAYFSDMEGAFQTERCDTDSHGPVRRNGRDRCLQQVITQEPAKWGRVPYPLTLVGSTQWANYQVSSDTLLQDSSSVGIGGRITDEYNVNKEPHLMLWNGYYLWLDKTGTWSLQVNLPQTGKKGVPTTKTLATGTVQGFNANAWHNLAIQFSGDQITPLIDGSRLTTVLDDTYSAGQTSLLVNGYTKAQFDNYSARPLPESHR